MGPPGDAVSRVVPYPKVQKLVPEAESPEGSQGRANPSFGSRTRAGAGAVRRRGPGGVAWFVARRRRVALTASGAGPPAAEPLKAGWRLDRGPAGQLFSVMSRRQRGSPGGGRRGRTPDRAGEPGSGRL